MPTLLVTRELTGSFSCPLLALIDVYYFEENLKTTHALVTAVGSNKSLGALQAAGNASICISSVQLFVQYLFRAC